MRKLVPLVLILFFYSCKKEKTVQIYSESQVLGKWIYDGLKVNGTYYPYEHRDKCGKDRFYFVNSPGRDHSYEEIIYAKKDYCSITQTYLVWQLNGYNLTLNFGKQAFNYHILKLNDTNFDVSIKVDYDGDGKEDDVEIYAIRGVCGNDTFCP